MKMIMFIFLPLVPCGAVTLSSLDTLVTIWRLYQARMMMIVEQSVE
jgi:hypothetical protein